MNSPNELDSKDAIASTKSTSKRRLNRWQHNPTCLVAVEGDRQVQQSFKLD